MKLILIAVCALAAARADVSHLHGDGYNYEKPSHAFELPSPVSTPSNEYLSPHSHATTPNTGPSQIHYEDHQGINQGPSSEYLPPTAQKNSLTLFHQEVSQPQYNAPAAAGPDFQQQVSHASQGPSNDYLPPTGLPVHTEISHITHAAQPDYNAPPSTPVHHHEISNEYLPPQVRHEVPNRSSINHLESSHPVAAPVHDYLPPQQQYDTAAQVTPRHQEIPQAVYSAPHQAEVHSHEISQINSYPQYSAPVQGPAHHHKIPQIMFQSQYSGPSQAPVHHHEIPQIITQPKYSTPISAPVHNHRIPQTISQPQHSGLTFAPVHQQEISHTLGVSQPQYSAPAVQPVSSAINEYLPPQQQHYTPSHAPAPAPAPAPLQYQEYPQKFPTSSNEYLPPSEHHHHEHHQEDQQIHGHQHEQQDSSHEDGYHYEVPARRFRF